MKDFWAKAASLEKNGTSFVVVTMISSAGHAPQDPGAKAIVTTEGLFAGTVGGGKIEAKAITLARQQLMECESSGMVPSPTLVKWNLQRDIGMSCGGEATLLFETHRPRAWRIAVFGAGHVAQALVRALIPLRCHVDCIDHREEWLARLPEAENLSRHREERVQELVGSFPVHTHFVVMTQGHATDVPVLKKIFETHASAPFIGVLGSDVKSLKIRRELSEHGVPLDLIASLECPMGLEIGGNDPAEIALSIAARLLQVRGQHVKVLESAAREEHA